MSNLPVPTGEIAERRPTLWSLTEQAEMLQATLAAIDDDTDARRIAESFLSDTEMALLDKLEAYAEVILLKQAREKALAERAATIGAEAKRESREAKSMLDCLKEWWRLRGVTKAIRTATHTINMVTNGGSEPLEIDEAQLPLKYFGWSVNGETRDNLCAFAEHLSDMKPGYARQLRELIFQMKMDEPDKERIRKAILAGETVPGASIGVCGQRITIR